MIKISGETGIMEWSGYLMEILGPATDTDYQERIHKDNTCKIIDVVKIDITMWYVCTGEVFICFFLLTSKYLEL